MTIWQVTMKQGWIVAALLVLTACGPSPYERGQQKFSQGASGCEAQSRSETERVECYNRVYTEQFTAEYLDYNQFLPTWRAERLQIAKDYEGHRIATSVATALIQQSDGRMQAAAQAQRDARHRNGDDEPGAIKLLNFAGSVAELSSIHTCFADDPDKRALCDHMDAVRKYQDCLKVHDEYICEPFRKEAYPDEN